MTSSRLTTGLSHIPLTPTAMGAGPAIAASSAVSPAFPNRDFQRTGTANDNSYYTKALSL